jgi:hypothetical protein
LGKSVVVDLAALLGAANQIALANEAISKGLRVLPLNERLYRQRMTLEGTIGNQIGVQKAFDELRLLLGSDDLFGPAEPSSETIELRNNFLSAEV